jgi:hypothetical protein
VVEEPYSGAWVADTVDTAAPTGSVAMPGTDPWIGTVVSSVQDGGRYLSRIVGGRGGLGKTLPDRWYNGTLLADTVAQDAIAEASESAGSVALGVRIDSWLRKADTLGNALSQLVATSGGVWWLARDGSVNVGPSRAGSVISPSTVAKVSTDVDGSVLLNLNTAVVKPGDTWLGRTIKHVRHTLTSDSFTSAISFDDLPSLTLSLDYLRTYSARVDSQHSDGTLDLIADGRFAVTSVPWLTGVPAKVTILPGDLVTLGWLGGDPRAPYAALLAQTSGTKAAAGVGDTVDCGWLVYPIQGTGVGTVVIPPLLYFPAGDLGAAAARLAAVPPYGPDPINLQGVITSGNGRLLL